MAKFGVGHEWNLTEARYKKVISLLEHQYTEMAIALEFKIAVSTLRRKLIDAGIVSADVRNAARVNMRARMLDSIDGIRDPSKKVDAVMKYLDRYPVTEDVEIVDVVDVIDTESILAKIKGDLDG